MSIPNIPIPSVITAVGARSAPQSTVDTSVISPPTFRCLTASDLWYYDRWLERTEPPAIYQYLLSKAKNRVWVWDPYVNSEDLKLFSHIPNGVTVKVLSFWGRNKKTPLTSLMQAVVNEVSNQYRSWKFDIELKYYNTFYDPEPVAPFHDRYLFIDDEVYMVGSSLTHHHKRNSSTAVVKIVADDAKLLLRSRFDQCWNHAITEHLLLCIGGQLTL